MESQYHAESVGKPPTRSIFLKTSLNFAQRGIPTFPLKGKRPLTPHGFKDASIDPSRVTAMFNAAPNATGVGIPTGGVSGLVVADKDRDSEEVRRIWDSLPPTLEVATGRASGVGRHRYYHVPKGTKVKSRDLVDGLELKGDGCYVVAPGSMHPSGSRYVVSNRVEIADLPAHLLEPEPTPQPSRRREPSTIGIDTGPIPEGTRNETLTSIAGRLHDGTRDAGALAEDLLAINNARCTPPLPEAEVRQIAKSIAGRNPCKPAVTPRVLAAVGHLREAAAGRPVRGMAGATGWSIYLAGLDALAEHGREHPEGATLSLDVRTWAQRAGTSRATVSRHIRRSPLMRVIRRGSGRRSAVVLFVAPSEAIGHYLRHSSSVFVSQENSTSASVSSSALSETLASLRWGPGRVGKSRAAILHKLVECGRPLSRKELASRLGRKPEGLRAPLKWLVDAGLLRRVARGVYDVPDDLRERVEDARQIAGEPEADRLQIARHDRERDAYRRRNTFKPTPHLANRKADGFISELERVPTSATVAEIEATMPEKVDGIYVHDALCECYLCDVPPRYANPWRGA